MSTEKAMHTPWHAPAGLIRISAILYVGLTAGHMSAYPWTSTHDPRESGLAASMKSIPFEFMGGRSSYWSLYFGWGLLVGVLLLTMAIILWCASRLARSEPRGVSAISGIVCAASLVGAWLSLRFFFIPPFIFFSVICILLATATVRLLAMGDARIEKRIA